MFSAVPRVICEAVVPLTYTSDLGQVEEMPAVPGASDVTDSPVAELTVPVRPLPLRSTRKFGGLLWPGMRLAAEYHMKRPLMPVVGGGGGDGGGGGEGGGEVHVIV